MAHYTLREDTGVIQPPQARLHNNQQCKSIEIITVDHTSSKLGRDTHEIMLVPIYYNYSTRSSLETGDSGLISLDSVDTPTNYYSLGHSNSTPTSRSY